jgi:hypothetical protein
MLVCSYRQSKVLEKPSPCYPLLAYLNWSEFRVSSVTEAAAIIRNLDLSYAEELPIIDLTVNAISGMKEMFLEKGFNDYLLKPIEMLKLAFYCFLDLGTSLL